MAFEHEIPKNARYQMHTLADGKRMRFAIFEPEKEPSATILIAPGRREFIEKLYLEMGREMALRGFRVIAFEWRGQGLSGRMLGGDMRQRDHLDNLDIHIGDLRSFYREAVKPLRVGKLILCAHSMGALIAARWLAENPETRPAIDAMIMVSPALAIGLPLLSHATSAAAVALGFGKSYAAGQHDYDDRDRAFGGNVLTHDPARFAIMEKYFDGNPDMCVGGVTWGWLATVTKSLEKVKAHRYLKHIPTWTLALVGDKDVVTPARKTVPLLRGMGRAEIHVIRGALHDIMNEAHAFRIAAWGHIDAFLNRVLAD